MLRLCLRFALLSLKDSPAMRRSLSPTVRTKTGDYTESGVHSLDYSRSSHASRLPPVIFVEGGAYGLMGVATLT